MAITNDEWQKLAKLLDERLDIKLEEKLSKKFSEFEVKFDNKLVKMQKTINIEIGDYITEELLPLIDEKANKTDTDRIERKLDRAIDRLYGHEDRISNIESVPVVTHHLSIKKAGKKSSD